MMPRYHDRDRAAEGIHATALGATAADVDLERVWLGVAAEAWAVQDGRVERLLTRVLRSPGLARAIVTTPSLVLSWIVASAAVFIVGVVATASSGTPWIALLAPALAGAGVAYAYGPGVDPAFELGQTMAVPQRTVLLARVLAVCALNALLGLLAALVSAQAAGLTLGWLVPMTTIAALGLATATLARSANAGVACAQASWSLIVLGGAVNTGDIAAAVERGALLPLYAAGTAICIGLTLYATSGKRMGSVPWQWQ